MTSPAPVQHRFVLRLVLPGARCPAIGEKVNPNHFDGRGDQHDDLRVAKDQAAIAQDLEKAGCTIIVCDTFDWTRAA